MNRKLISFVIVIALLIITLVYAATTGSIQVSFIELVKGLVSGNDNDVNVIKDLRLPRIIIAIFAGGALSVSGVLLQAVMRNPLAEPGIIGVASGASFFTVLAVSFFPALFFYTPLIACIGGGIAFCLVYSFSPNLVLIR